LLAVLMVAWLVVLMAGSSVVLRADRWAERTVEMLAASSARKKAAHSAAVTVERKESRWAEKMAAQ